MQLVNVETRILIQERMIIGEPIMDIIWSVNIIIIGERLNDESFS